MPKERDPTLIDVTGRWAPEGAPESVPARVRLTERDDGIVFEIPGVGMVGTNDSGAYRIALAILKALAKKGVGG